MPTAHRRSISTLLEAPGGTAVEVQGGRQSDAAAVASQLFAIRREIAREPDLVVAFGEPANRPPVDWETLGTTRWVLHAAIGTRRVPYLSQLSRLRTLERGSLPLHAAAGESRGAATVIAGRPGAGKTDLFLSLLGMGWAFVAGEWLVLRDRSVDGADDTVDLRSHHLRSHDGVRIHLGPRGQARRWLARIGPLKMLDRFELRSRDLGVKRTEQGQRLPVARVVWVQRTSASPRIQSGGWAEISPEMVRSEASRYAGLRELHRRNVEHGLPPVPLVRDIERLIEDRVRAQLADLPLLVVEHAGAWPMADLAPLLSTP